MLIFMPLAKPFIIRHNKRFYALNFFKLYVIEQSVVRKCSALIFVKGGKAALLVLE